VAVLAVLPSLSPEARVDGERAVERARYAFVIGATQPFEEVYPRALFEGRVAREIQEEGVLAERFGMTVTRELLETEYERIEGSTKASEQWEAIKRALDGDRRRIEDVFCRPLLVSRALHARFAFDQAIHSEAHENARKARALFLASKSPPEAHRVKVRLGADGELPSTEALLAAAKAEAGTGPRVLTPPSQPPEDAPGTASPEVAEVLDKQLRDPGNVTTILEERDQFEVYRLVDRAKDVLTVEVVRVPKRDFESWFAVVSARPAATGAGPALEVTR
jgi:hypothetical protein